VPNLPEGIVIRTKQGKLLSQQDIEAKRRQLREKICTLSGQKSEIKWEYCLLSGQISPQGQCDLLAMLSRGETLEIPDGEFFTVVDELGKQGWEMVEALVISDLGSQYPTRNLVPGWVYKLDAVLQQPTRSGVYAYESVREVNGLLYIFKRVLRS
jgi:hypothetical protein